MIRHILAVALTLATLSPAQAQEETDSFALGGDSYQAGGSLSLGGGVRDAFLAGERVEVSQPVTGSVHAAARRIAVTADVGGSLYAMGQDIAVEGPVGGSASLAGYDVTVTGAIGGNLRATADTLVLRAPVAGSALLAGDAIEIAGAIAGDAAVTADSLVFGEGASIGGRLTLYADAGDQIDVPASVIPAERIDRRDLSDRPVMEQMAGPGPIALILGFLGGVIILGVIASIVAAVGGGLRGVSARLREGLWRAIGYGALAQSALIGGAFLLVLTIIGALVAPVALVASALLGALGYLLGVWLLGDRIVRHFGGDESDTVPEYFRAGIVGALAATLLALVPFLGWLFTLALSLAGAGAFTLARLRR